MIIIRYLVMAAVALAELKLAGIAAAVAASPPILALRCAVMA